VNRVDAVWVVGRVVIGTPVRIFAPMRVYGRDRVPQHTGVVLAMNHFSWLDPPAFGIASPRTIYYMAKSEAHRVPGLGELIRSFGTFSVRRGESDREAVRRMREVVRERKLLGIFAEGTRQRSGVPGPVQPGAAMVAIQESVPVVCGAVHGTQSWEFGRFSPVSVAWGEPMRFDGVPRGAKGYREASAEIEREIHRLWSWLRDLHEAGAPRPRHAVPPRAPVERRAPVTLP
jgi:1-acyl-sn-glycerol-3-phosphate acyltransferase